MFGKRERNDNLLIFLYACVHTRLRRFEDTAAFIGRICLRRDPSHRDMNIEEDLDACETPGLQDQGKRFRSAPIEGQNRAHVVGEHEAPRLGQATT